MYQNSINISSVLWQKMLQISSWRLSVSSRRGGHIRKERGLYYVLVLLHVIGITDCCVIGIAEASMGEGRCGTGDGRRGYAVEAPSRGISWVFLQYCKFVLWLSAAGWCIALGVRRSIIVQPMGLQTPSCSPRNCNLLRAKIFHCSFQLSKLSSSKFGIVNYLSDGKSMGVGHRIYLLHRTFVHTKHFYSHISDTS